MNDYEIVEQFQKLWPERLKKSARGKGVWIEKRNRTTLFGTAFKLAGTNVVLILSPGPKNQIREHLIAIDPSKPVVADRLIHNTIAMHWDATFLFLLGIAQKKLTVPNKPNVRAILLRHYLQEARAYIAQHPRKARERFKQHGSPRSILDCFSRSR